ncbi:hypothetical protein M011DRAFT_467438 [Sporormia fimetaria CBS 119925]|uniref:Uncharacterized protein n=1 Tax=Sporormia fimetaria CBS 119925 TaxID=1340428 RepID=A0A6A6VBB5_9PLEO|nr:hypothetical protein M011DRAFT_467438 [Sporormia fimetaria CBS 119925]
MDSSSSTLDPTALVPTPSGLTPNTRSEAEAALWQNSLAQTDAAAPTTPPPSHAHDKLIDDIDEARQAYYRHTATSPTTSDNYAKAMERVRKEESAASTDTTITESSTGDTPLAASGTTSLPFPGPGQGVVPLHTGVGAGQSEAVKKGRSRGLSLGMLGRQPSYSGQDRKHLLSAGLMEKPGGEDKGYTSGGEGKGEE